MVRIQIGSSMSPRWVYGSGVYEANLVDLLVGVIGVASSRSRERGLAGSCGNRGLVELAPAWVHSDPIACTARMGV